MSINLQDILKKFNVKSVFDLNDEEKETYHEWETILNGRKLTDEDVKGFLDAELEETLTKLTSQVYNSREDIFLKVKLEMIRKIKTFLNLPETQKKILEQSIKSIK